MLVTLHIGWHRTGSTALQAHLHAHRTSLARRYGIAYPVEGLLGSAHHPIAWALQGRTESAWGPVRGVDSGPEACMRAAIERARNAGATHVVFSTEEFRNFDREAVARIAGALRTCAEVVRIVVYLRRQDRLAESSYNMEVQWWARRAREGFLEYVAGPESSPAYRSVLERWADAFGRDAIVARAYRRDATDAWDVRSDFAGVLGIPPGALPPRAEGLNDSLGPTTLEALRVLNNLAVSNDVHRSIVARLHEFDAEHRSPRAVLFEPRSRRAFLESQEAANDGLGAFGVDRNAFVLDGASMPERNVYPLSPQAFAGLFSYLAAPGVPGQRAGGDTVRGGGAG